MHLQAEDIRKRVFKANNYRQTMPNAKNQTKGKQPAKPLLAFSCLQLSFKALQFNFAIDQFNDHFK